MSDELHNKQELEDLYQLMHQYKKRFIRFASSYIGDYEAAEDYVLESFMDYWTNRYTLESHTNIPAYILTVVKYKCLNHIRSKRNREAYSDQVNELRHWELNLQFNSLDVCDPKELFTTEIRQIVNHTLAQLSPETKQIFCLSRFEDKSRKEIAELMDISVKGVEYHIHKAITELRKNLKDYIHLFF